MSGLASIGSAVSQLVASPRVSGGNDFAKIDFEIQSFEEVKVDVRQPASTGASRGPGQVVLDDLSFTKEVDKSSPKLAEEVVNGSTVDGVEIDTHSQTNDAAYLKYEVSALDIRA
ncbi:MAG: type VI secretion system tube protein Hcp [Pirellulaceae bacterium]|jgi:type VI protein secretion system component Hcp|nr:type VI secretion system tube protein Hcp [Pirellulaceae bacterium]MDP7020701.1 type VI secretion system tube protein Hcp [Pirellulaceae bacterium]